MQTYKKHEVERFLHELDDKKERILLKTILDSYDRIEAAIRDLNEDKQHLDFIDFANKKSIHTDVNAFITGIIESEYDVTQYYEGKELMYHDLGRKFGRALQDLD